MNRKRLITYIIAILVLLFGGMALAGAGRSEKRVSAPADQPGSPPVDLERYAVATLAGGCFWCLEPPFERLPGVAEVISGYTGGEEAFPSYREVASGRTGHFEAVQVYYDPAIISYRNLCGRIEFQEKFWSQNTENKEMSMTEKEKRVEELSPLQYKVTQECATENPFNNKYWDNKEAGIYVDVVSKEPLFSSTAKFESGTGWPSFYEPIQKENVIETVDTSHFMVRTEVRSSEGESHLGHLFKDGPTPTGLRYCINSASLRFIPREKMEEEGYGEFLYLFN